MSNSVIKGQYIYIIIKGLWKNVQEKYKIKHSKNIYIYDYVKIQKETSDE